MAPAHSRPRNPHTRAVQVNVRWDLITRVIAFDIEFQLVMDTVTGRRWERIGRISVVNEHGQVIYDVFVYYPEEAHLEKFLPGAHRKLGVYRDDIKASSGAVHVKAVEANLARIIERAEIVVGHSINGDIKTCKDGMFDGVKIRDTQQHEYYRRWGIGRQRLPRLAVLAREELGIEALQADEHSSVEDAKATMALYQKRKEQIEAEQGARVHFTPQVIDESWFENAIPVRPEQTSTSSEQGPSPAATQQTATLSKPRTSMPTTPATAAAASSETNDTKATARPAFLPPHLKPRNPSTPSTLASTRGSRGSPSSISSASPSAKVAAAKVTPPQSNSPLKTSSSFRTGNQPKANIPLKPNPLKMNASLNTNSSSKTNGPPKANNINKFNATSKTNTSSKTYKNYTSSPAKKGNSSPRPEIKTKPGASPMMSSKGEPARNIVRAPSNGIRPKVKPPTTGENLTNARMGA